MNDRIIFIITSSFIQKSGKTDRIAARDSYNIRQKKLDKIKCYVTVDHAKQPRSS